MKFDRFLEIVWKLGPIIISVTMVIMGLLAYFQLERLYDVTSMLTELFEPSDYLPDLELP
jgi:heme/copper-type cytochrome/quinol oxidase subunit 2